LLESGSVQSVQSQRWRNWHGWLQCLAALVCLTTACQLDDTDQGRAELDNAEFRDRVVALVHDLAVGVSEGGSGQGSGARCTVPQPRGLAEPSRVVVSFYEQGEVVGRGSAVHERLCVALTLATLAATEEASEASGLSPSRLAEARFVVELITLDTAIVEYEGQGLELVGGAKGVVPTRVLDKDLIRRRIDEGQAYLLRVLDPDLGGVHKIYEAETDSHEPRLHTVYTASTLYTLLRLYARTGDESLRAPIDRGAEFLFAMQRLTPDPTEAGHGAFHYAFNLDDHVREPRLVVGTSAKAIFTLLELHALTQDPRTLDAATLAGDWLLTMQSESGLVASEVKQRPAGTWGTYWPESLLYTGQVLSAWSRLYRATADARYLEAGTRTAERLLAKVEDEGCYLGDDYRSPNPISSSWVILSLFEFAQASDDARAREVAYACADELVARQIRDPDDVLVHGRWPDSLSSSGSGWLAEVLSELYLDCPASAQERCASYREAVVLLMRLLMQHTYAPENSFVAKDPAMAHGGLFWTARDRYVRTDSVCHAMNAYLLMLDELPDELPDGVLIELPEPPLFERLGL
jgi:hypothetical protein